MGRTSTQARRNDLRRSYVLSAIKQLLKFADGSTPFTTLLPSIIWVPVDAMNRNLLGSCAKQVLILHRVGTKLRLRLIRRVSVARIFGACPACCEAARRGNAYYRSAFTSCRRRQQHELHSTPCRSASRDRSFGRHRIPLILAAARNGLRCRSLCCRASVVPQGMLLSPMCFVHRSRSCLCVGGA